MTTRLNKYLASCGLGSRRNVEEIIKAGRVICNGYLVTEPAHQVPDGAVVTVDDMEVFPEKRHYVVLNKPRGYLCAVKDGSYPVVMDLLPRRFDDLRLYPVGRLDLQSEGLLILSNDGDFVQQLIHPRASIPKEYEVRLDREVEPQDLAHLRQGIIFEGRALRPLKVAVLQGRKPERRWVSFTLAEGIKREIRMIAEQWGYKVEVLFRRRIGGLELRRLRSGECCEVTRDELWHMIRNGGTL